MKDVTSTSFGLVIAFLLPGFVGLYSLTFWSANVQEMFHTFLTAQSNLGLFLLVVLVALVIGLLVTPLRWLLFERFLCKSYFLTPDDFAELGTEAKLVAFRAATDELYRYHQFWGGTAIAMLPLYVGWLWDSWSFLNYAEISLSIIGFITVEVVTGLAAIEAYRRHITRSKRILKGGENA